jgi:glycine hydroxymethyltransferase
MTTRGLKEADFEKIVELTDRVLMHHDNDTILAQTRLEVNNWMKQFPLY